jgi:hypothetical protein
MKNTQNFDIWLCQEEPSMFAPQWTREFEFIFETEENDVEKRYRGYYWWNSEGEEGVKWDEFEEKPDFGEHEEEITNQIISEATKLIAKLEKEKEDYWRLP